jgi:hypothetical protein
LFQQELVELIIDARIECHSKEAMEKVAEYWENLEKESIHIRGRRIGSNIYLAGRRLYLFTGCMNT